jgi:hypothetical protein
MLTENGRRRIAVRRNPQVALPSIPWGVSRGVTR